MKTQTTPDRYQLIATIEGNKQLRKAITAISHYSTEDFIRDAGLYIASIRERRMFCIIHSVARSGMSRVMSFHSFDVAPANKVEPRRGNTRQYNCLFLALGFKQSADRNGFKINGCGMDMVFATNYNLIHNLHRLGFIDKAECDKLAQMTPNVF